MHPVLLLILLIGAFIAIGWYKNQPKAAQKSARIKALLIGLGIIIVLGLITGRLNPLIAAIGAMVPVALRLLRYAPWLKSILTSGPTSTNQSSQVKTRFLYMTLDHETGDLDGTILEGQAKGRKLSELDVETIVNLLYEWRTVDEQSAAILQAYLERMHTDAWQGHDDGQTYAGGALNATTMGPEEAREILGVDTDASGEDVIAAHRRLMQKMHPDRGGSNYLAAKINQAKDVLLG